MKCKFCQILLKKLIDLMHKEEHFWIREKSYIIQKWALWLLSFKDTTLYWYWCGGLNLFFFNRGKYSLYSHNNKLHSKIKKATQIKDIEERRISGLHFGIREQSYFSPKNQLCCLQISCPLIIFHNRQLKRAGIIWISSVSNW